MEMRDRRIAVVSRAAEEAAGLPVTRTGLWFDDDVRRTFYLAVHLFAASADLQAGPSTGQLSPEQGRELACSMISRVLRLQRQDPDDPMYGHWPISVSPEHPAGVANLQPGELMVCILVLFRRRYADWLPFETLDGIDRAVRRQYESSYARTSLYEMHHHDATHVAQRLLLGQLYDDADLTRRGLDGTARLLAHLRRFGFKEYGALPWFWHWIQAFACVWEVSDDGEVKDAVAEMLEVLWDLRVDSYLAGAWVGPRSRQWPHDMPTDTNVAIDFIQFGDFPLGSALPRLEGAALFTYEVPPRIRDRALDRNEPSVDTKRVLLATAEQRVEGVVNLYTYITATHAVGGVWERRRQFDNEQHRWDVALPITERNVDRNVNHAYFFHPGPMYSAGDLRHQSTYGDVLFLKDTVMELWNVPADDTTAHPEVLGCLPLGEWVVEDRHGYGRVEDTFMSFHTMGDVTWTAEADRIVVRAPLDQGRQGVIVEVVGRAEAESAEVRTPEELKAFHELVNRNMYRSMITKTPPYFSTGRGVAAGGTNSHGDDVAKTVASYVTFRGAHLLLEVDTLGRCERFVDGSVLTLDSYLAGL